MATHDYPLGLGQPDSSGDVWPSTVQVEASLSNAKNVACMVFNYNISADRSVELSFLVPQDYVGTPKILICGVLDGVEAQPLAFGAQTEASSIDDNETFDVAYSTEALVEVSNLSSSYADEDYIELEITLAHSYTAGERVNLKLFRDADQDDCVSSRFCLIGLYFRYSDA